MYSVLQTSWREKEAIALVDTIGLRSWTSWVKLDVHRSVSRRYLVLPCALEPGERMITADAVMMRVVSDQQKAYLSELMAS